MMTITHDLNIYSLDFRPRITLRHATSSSPEPIHQQITLENNFLVPGPVLGWQEKNWCGSLGPLGDVDGAMGIGLGMIGWCLGV